MNIGSTFNHEIYGPLQITGKRYARRGNKVLWLGKAEDGEIHELDGTEKPAKPEKASPKFLKEAAEMFGMTQGPQGDKGLDADEEAIIAAVIPQVLERIELPENGKDGLDADTELIVKELLPLVMKEMPRPKEVDEIALIGKILARVKIPQDGKDGMNGNDGSPDSPSDIKEKLESLKGSDRLDARAIKNLPKQQIGGGAGSSGLQYLQDVKLTNPTDNQSLTYDSASGKWVNETVSGGGSGTVETIVAGNNIDVDATDPANPIVSVETLTLADISDVTASITELNYIDGVTSAIQTQLDAKQPLDSDLTTLAGLTATTDNFIISVSSAWASRTPSQARTSLGLGTAALVATDLADLNEATIEGAIDTLANLTSIQGRTVTLADAGANAIFGWDDVAGAYENLTQAEVLAVIGDSTATAKGVVELATDAETVTGTDTARATTPANITAKMAAPGTIGGTTPGAATFTTLTATTVNAFTTGGNITLAENTSIALDPAGSADGKYSGTTVTGTAGATLAFGDLIYLDPTDSRWELTDGNAAAGADGDARGMIGMCVLAAAADGNATTILLHGIIRADANFPALTIGAPVYVAETAGDIVVTQPTTTDAVIRQIGFAITADELYFNPTATWTTHT